mmetsp:Transcript_28241/g.42749  ORF Transcript_28241/g.42749 Transcript_28241/m.42749 type:complete len:303 (+) Transcript_28241:1091-1999(+)
MSHNASDGVRKVADVSEVISQPPRSHVTRASVGASLNDHRPSLLLLEPGMRGRHLVLSKERVDIELEGAVGMDGVERQGLHLEVSSSGHVRQVPLDGIGGLLEAVLGSVDEVGGLVHVHPEAVELHLVVEHVEVVQPEGLAVVRVEVGERRIARPDLALDSIAVGVLDVCISVKTVLVGVVAGVLADGDSSIEDGNVPHVFVVELVNEVGQILKVEGVVGEVLEGVQVVDVRPLHIERDLVIRVVSHNLSQVVGVRVAPPALVPAKRPLRDSHGSSYDGVVSLGYTFRSCRCHEVEVSNATC